MENQEEEHTCMTDEERRALSRAIGWNNPDYNLKMEKVSKEVRIRWEKCKACQRFVEELEKRNK